MTLYTLNVQFCACLKALFPLDAVHVIWALIGYYCVDFAGYYCVDFAYLYYQFTIHVYTLNIETHQILIMIILLSLNLKQVHFTTC